MSFKFVGSNYYRETLFASSKSVTHMRQKKTHEQKFCAFFLHLKAKKLQEIFALNISTVFRDKARP